LAGVSPFSFILVFIHPCLQANGEVSVAPVPSAKNRWDFFTGFWIIAENKLRGKHEFMIQRCFGSAGSFSQINITDFLRERKSAEM